MPSRLAVIVASPGDTPVTSPPATVAFDSSSLAHVAIAVMSIVESSLYVPVAVSCSIVPAARLGAGGVSAIETSRTFAAVTAPDSGAAGPRADAVTVADPGATPVIVTDAPAPSTVTVFGLLETQVTSSAGTSAPATV